MRRYNSDGVVEEPRLQEGERVICEITHNESTFYANNQRRQGYWHPNKAKAPVRKEEGSSIMVADFLTPEIGRLKDNVEYMRLNNVLGCKLQGLTAFSVKHGCSSKQAKAAMAIG
jgi:hypothetical protein